MTLHDARELAGFLVLICAMMLNVILWGVIWQVTL